MSFIELGRATMRQQERDQAREDREAAKAEAAIKQAAVEAALRAQGIIPEEEAVTETNLTNLEGGMQATPQAPEASSPIRVPFNVMGGSGPKPQTAELPAMQAPTQQQPSRGVSTASRTSVDPSRYARLGTTGRALDQTRTPAAQEARAKAAEVLAQRQSQASLAELIQRGMAGDQGAAAQAVAMVPTLANTIFKPKEEKAPRPYQPTTREEAMRDAEERARIAARYRAPSGGSGEGGAAQKVTEGERRGAALLRVAEDAFPILQSAKAPTRAEAVLARMRLNEGLSQERQLVEQSARQFVTSYLYVVSGATASPQEVENLVAQIVPEPGDKPATVQRKKAAQQSMLNAIREVGGRAAGPAPAPQNPWR